LECSIGDSHGRTKVSDDKRYVAFPADGPVMKSFYRNSVFRATVGTSYDCMTVSHMPCTNVLVTDGNGFRLECFY
jgi:hypothetical protein